MKIIAKRESDMLMSEFADMVQKGRLAKILSVGDQLTVEYRGRLLLLDVIDLNKDGDGTVTVQTHYTLDDIMKYSEKGTLAWESSDIRKYLHHVFLPGLDDDFKKLLTVRKSTNTIGGDTLDRAFIPSVDEW